MWTYCCLVLVFCRVISHIMSRPSLAHLSRQPSLRYVDLAPYAAGSSAHRHLPTWSLPSSIIMQRGPPRIGIPHLVATKSNYHAAGSSAHSASPTWSLPSLQYIQRKEQDKISKLSQQLLLRPPRSSRQVKLKGVDKKRDDGTEGHTQKGEE
jgi:hypothetical protein